MQHLIDKMMATKQDYASARLWAEYAINNYGPGGLDLLHAGFDEPMGTKSRWTLRLAIRIAANRLHQRIWVATMPSAAPAGIAGAR